MHIGHLRAAEEVAEALGLEKVLFVLSARPPHKGGFAHAPAEDRFEMLKRALAGNPRFEPCELELRRPGLSYSIDTVRELSQQGTELYFLVGEDAFRGIKSWKRWEELLDLCPFVILRRTEEDLYPFLQELGYKKEGGEFRTLKGTPLYLVRVTEIQVSSTLIRDLLRQGRSIRYLVPEGVREYILERRLYSLAEPKV